MSFTAKAATLFHVEDELCMPPPREMPVEGIAVMNGPPGACHDGHLSLESSIFWKYYVEKSSFFLLKYWFANLLRVEPNIFHNNKITRDLTRDLIGI